MKYIEAFQEGATINDVYLVKHVQQAMTKSGKPYLTVVLQDRTGTIDGKIWDVGNPGICDFDKMDYLFVNGEVTSFNGTLQLNIKRARKAEEGMFDPSDYLPITDKDIEEMYTQLLGLVDSIKEVHLKQLLESFFLDADFKKRFCFHSAAKSVHHGFVGGLLEHTLSVAKICNFYAQNYPELDRDLLVTAAICHDIGKLSEIAPFPMNDYTDDGQLLGHIIIGSQMVRDKIREIDGFPQVKANELIHCILSHHGELEYGSPKKPAIAEAIALSFADNIDAKMETFKEAIKSTDDKDMTWQGYNRFLETNIRRTSK